MNEGLKGYRDKLAENVEEFSIIIEKMKDRRLQSFEVDTSTGARRDTTAENIPRFEEIISTLNARCGTSISD